MGLGFAAQQRVGIGMAVAWLVLAVDSLHGEVLITE